MVWKDDPVPHFEDVRINNGNLEDTLAIPEDLGTEGNDDEKERTLNLTLSVQSRLRRDGANRYHGTILRVSRSSSPKKKERADGAPWSQARPPSRIATMVKNSTARILTKKNKTNKKRELLVYTVVAESLYTLFSNIRIFTL
jgi:hypothetical protein